MKTLASPGLAINNSISLGNMEVVLDFLADPDKFEPDLSETREKVSAKKPIEIIRKPVIKPKITREGLISKFSLVQKQHKVSDEILSEDDDILEDDDGFEFTGFDDDPVSQLNTIQSVQQAPVQNIQQKQNVETESDKLKQAIMDTDDDIDNNSDSELNIEELNEAEQAAFIGMQLTDDNEDNQSDTDDIDMSELDGMFEDDPSDKSNNSGEDDIDMSELDEMFEDDEEETAKSSTPAPVAVKAPPVTKTTQVVSKQAPVEQEETTDNDELELDEDLEEMFEDDNEEEEAKAPVPVKTPPVAKPTPVVEKQVAAKPKEISGIDISELDELDDDDEESNQGDIPGIDMSGFDDIELDDDDDDTDDEDAKQVATSSIQADNSVKTVQKAINSKEEVKKIDNEDDEIEFDINLDDIDLDDDDDTEEVVNHPKASQKRPVVQVTTQEEQSSLQDDKNYQLLAELNRLKEENKRLKQSNADSQKVVAKQKTVSEKPKHVVTQQENVVTQPKPVKKDSIDELLDNSKKVKATEPESSKYDKYTVMNIDALYSIVSRYMLDKGVKQKPIDVAILNEQFGTENIKKLLVKQYLIKTKKGVTVGI